MILHIYCACAETSIGTFITPGKCKRYTVCCFDCYHTEESQPLPPVTVGRVTVRTGRHGEILKMTQAIAWGREHVKALISKGLLHRNGTVVAEIDDTTSSLRPVARHRPGPRFLNDTFTRHHLAKMVCENVTVLNK